MAAGDISFRSCKGKMSGIESLPDDIVFNILLRVPAQDIYKTTRLVCKKWYKMIHTHNFVLAHDLQHSTSGLMWSLGSRENRSAFIAFRDGQVVMSIIDITGRILSSCNGLLLKYRRGFQELCIMNPSTRQHFSLLSLLADWSLGSAISYDATSKVYKVVRTLSERCNIVECAIFTVGVDKDWTRRVDIEHLPPASKEFERDLHATDGFVHWCKRGGVRKRGEKENVLTLNTEKEVITQFPVPVCDADSWYYYLPIGGGCLCLMIGRTEFLWEAWEMNPESGEWTMVMTIDLEAHKREFNRVCTRTELRPIGWLRFREVLIFCDWRYLSTPTQYTMAYSCRTGSIISDYSYEFDLNSGLSKFHVHRNSLVWVG